MKQLSVKSGKQLCLRWLLKAMVILQFLAIIFFNYTKAYDFLDMDSAGALRHGAEMWRNGIFLRDFNYFSSMEIDCAAFLAAPVYMITGNYSIALAAAQGLVYAALVWVIHDIFKTISASQEQFLLAVFLLFTPYSVGQLEWANMLFFSAGQYAFRVLLLLFLTDLVLYCEYDRERNWKLAVRVLAYSCLNFWTALSAGNYVLFMIVSPFILYVFVDSVAKQRIRLRMRTAGIILGSGIISLLGWMVHNHYMGQSSRSQLMLIPAEKFFDNLWNSVTGIFMLMGGLVNEEGRALFSAAGIMCVLKFVFTAGLGVLIWIWVKKKKGSMQLLNLAGITAFVHLCVFALTDTNYGAKIFEYRYHILWISMMLLCVGVLAVEFDYCGNIWVKKCVLGGILTAAAAINLGAFAILSHWEIDRSAEWSLIQMAEEKQAQAIYLTGESEEKAFILRAMDLNRYYAKLKVDGDKHVIDTGNFYQYFGDYGNAGEGTLLVCKEEEFLEMPEYVKGAYELCAQMEDGRVVYYSWENIWDDVSGPPPACLGVAVDLPYARKYQINGAIDENGWLVAETGFSGCILEGTDLECDKGIYDITLFYASEGDAGENARFCIHSNREASVLAEAVLPEDKESITLNGIPLEDGEKIAVQVVKPAGVDLKVEKINYRRVKCLNERSAEFPANIW